ncbi:MAG: hypothetical protein KA751_09285, partial [Comamonas sp.]|nr:hypothetical protein [Comamonas sp.]
MNSFAIQKDSSSFNYSSKKTNTQEALTDISRQADRLMLILISIYAVLAIPIGWHYSSVDMALIAS